MPGSVDACRRPLVYHYGPSWYADAMDSHVVDDSLRALCGAGLDAVPLDVADLENPDVMDAALICEACLEVAHRHAPNGNARSFQAD